MMGLISVGVVSNSAVLSSSNAERSEPRNLQLSLASASASRSFAIKLLNALEYLHSRVREMVGRFDMGYVKLRPSRHKRGCRGVR